MNYCSCKTNCPTRCGCRKNSRSCSKSCGCGGKECNNEFTKPNDKKSKKRKRATSESDEKSKKRKTRTNKRISTISKPKSKKHPKPSPEVLSKVKLFAKMNRKKKYYITSKQNNFGGIEVPYALIDTGCNSLLLPIEDGQLEELFEAFPFETYHWLVSGSKGVGALNSLVLMIKPHDATETINATLHGNVSFQVPYLRFHLCYEDATELQSIAEIQTDKLDNWLEVIASVRKLGVACGTRRTHALIGQMFLQAYCCVQISELFMVLDTTFPLVKLQNVLFHLQVEANYEAAQIMEFNDLEDDDHDGDDPNSIEYELNCDELNLA